MKIIVVVGRLRYCAALQILVMRENVLYVILNSRTKFSNHTYIYQKMFVGFKALLAIILSSQRVSGTMVAPGPKLLNCTAKQISMSASRNTILLGR